MDSCFVDCPSESVWVLCTTGEGPAEVMKGEKVPRRWWRGRRSRGGDEGGGNGNPLQCSCLENPRDRGAWWAAIHGVAQSWTRLTWLSSSSSRRSDGVSFMYHFRRQWCWTVLLSVMLTWIQVVSAKFLHHDVPLFPFVIKKYRIYRDTFKVHKYSLLISYSLYQFSSVQLLSHVHLFATPWIAARQAPLSITSSRSLLKLLPIETVMPSSHLILCRPLVPLPAIPPSIRVFSNESTLHTRWPEYGSFSFNIRPSNEHPGLISFRMDWLDLLEVQGTLKSLLQHHSSKASIFWCSAFFAVQLWHPYMTTGKTIALTGWTLLAK